jgi:8-oxo-dGTP pyrophosphatase MutT (NUDIX family)
MGEALVSKILKREDIKFIQPADKTYPPEITAMIEQTWAEKTGNKESKYLYDGAVFGLDSYVVCDDREHRVLDCFVSKARSDLAMTSTEGIVCFVYRTTYKAFIGTNIYNIGKIADKKQMANAMAACVVPLTTDGYVLVGKRSIKMAEGKGEWHIVGGTFEGVLQDGKLVCENPYDLILKELEEEINVLPEDIKDLYCTGLGISYHNHKPEFLFVGELKLNGEELIQRVTPPLPPLREGGDIVEHTEFRLIQTSELRDFVSKNRFAPIGELAIERFFEVQK